MRAAEDAAYIKSLSPNEYAREMLWRQGVERKIMPVCPLPPDLLQ